jgi:uroporphyrinogen-III synthase (EC 4.2.1.75)/uroporphyrinogen-III C-methyltransferase (EC 2.1.1.107)
VTAKTLKEYGFIPDIMPEDYTIPALVDALVKG